MFSAMFATVAGFYESRSSAETELSSVQSVQLPHAGASDARCVEAAQYRCSKCSNWFSENSSRNPTRASIRFSLNYYYSCATCSPGGVPVLSEKLPSFVQICTTALANLAHLSAKQGITGREFSRDHEILPFIDQFWEELNCPTQRTKNNLQDSVVKALASHPNWFHPKSADDGDVYYSLDMSNLERLNPYEFGTVVAKSTNDADYKTPAVKIQRLIRRKPAVPPPPPVPRSDFLSTLKAFPSCVPLEFPTNPNPFRYTLAECDRNSPLSAMYIANPEAWGGPQGKPIPGHMYRVFVENQIALSVQDRATQLKVSLDRLTVTGDKGYSMVRATHSVAYGRWYFEFKILEMPGNSAVRAGWGTVYSVLQAPLGYDRFGYSWRSRKGTRFHESKGKHYADIGYGKGDVVGCYIELPAEDIGNIMPESLKGEPLVKYKNHLYYEVRVDVPKQVQCLRPLKGSKVEFFRNGQSSGTAFSDINVGHYFPSISLYKNVTVKLNFGPSFEFPPSDLVFLPMSDRVVDASSEQTMADMLYSISNDLAFLPNGNATPY